MPGTLVISDEDTFRQGIVNAQHHHRIPPHNLAAHLHTGDVDVKAAQEGANFANDTGHIPVQGKQHVPGWGHVDGELVDVCDANFVAPEQHPGDGVLPERLPLAERVREPV
jgi:hypothetical protein